MRVYVFSVFFFLLSFLCLADDAKGDHEVEVVGDKNYSNSTLVYDGIDVSNYQKDINWDATVKDSNIKYVYIKATEGASHKQHRYRRNVEHARQRGIKVGSYHFMTTTAPIQAQFENFISVVRPEEQDLVPLLDVEKKGNWSNKQLQDSVMKFAKLLEDYYGCKPMIYASSNYFNNYLGEPFKNYPLFIARYSQNEPQLSYGAKWILWQFSDRGRIEGIDALVDLSRFNKGCGVKDIAYHYNSKPETPARRSHGDVPRPKRDRSEQPAVPPRPQQNNGGGNASSDNAPKSEAQRRGEENERRRQRLEEENRKKEEERRKKEEEKRKKEEEKRRKEEEKRKREEQKRQQELERKQQELERKQQEQERKRQEQERKRQEQERKRQEEMSRRRSNEQAQERMREQKEREAENNLAAQQRREQQRREELEQTRRERIDNERRAEASVPSTPSAPRNPNPRKPVANQSSADNEEVHYDNTHRRNRGSNK